MKDNMLDKLKKEKLEPEVLEIDLEEEYNPAGALDIPYMHDSDRYIYRWVRWRDGAGDDYRNVTARLRDGWVFVKEEDIPPGYVFPGLKSNIPQLAGCATNGDLVLAKLPRKRALQIQEWSQQLAIEAEQAYDRQRIRPEGSDYTYDRTGSKEVSFGRRKPKFG